MSTDPDDNRKAPTTWKEYLNDLAETKEIYKWVWREIVTKESRVWIVRIIAIQLLLTVLQLIQPYSISLVFDGLIRRDSRTIQTGLSAFIALILATAGVQYGVRVSREWIFGLIFARLDHRITELFFEKSVGQHIQESSTLNVGNIDKGRWKIVDLLAMFMFQGVPTLFGIVLAYVMCWIMSPVVGLIMTGMMLVFAAWSAHLNTHTLSECLPIDKDFRKLNRHRLERWEKTERVKVSGKTAQELTEMDTRFDDLIVRDRTFWIWYSGNESWREMVSSVFLILALVYGAYRSWQGVWSVALLYPLFSWSIRITENIWTLAYIERTANWVMPSIKSMIDAVMLKPDIVEPVNGVPIKAHTPIHVEFRNITHTFPAQTREQSKHASNRDRSKETRVLRDIGFTIEPGEKVALIGPSGAGKTTIMRMLLRYMDPQHGCVLVNGHDLRGVDLQSWMHCIGYIPQQPSIFDGSIKYNLAYTSRNPNKDHSDESLWELMKNLKIDFEGRLTDGLDTLVGRDGMKLSGGQAQRLMIGAAAAKRPSFMVIDEATSSLDSTTEKEVQQGLRDVLHNGVSALIVAHRLSTVRDICTKFVVLRPVSELINGDPQIEVIAHSFEDLIRISTTFKRLAADQGVTI